MKRTSPVAVICVVALIAVWAPARAQAPSTTNESPVFQLRIRVDAKSYAPRENFPIHVELTNVSSHDILVGRDLWASDSLSRVTFAVTPMDGHAMAGIQVAVDRGYPPGFRPDDSRSALLEWCLLLPPQYSYSSVQRVGTFVSTANLTPGSYKIRAEYESFGIDVNADTNPLLGHPKETARLQSESWKGIIGSNEIVVEILAIK